MVINIGYTASDIAAKSWSNGDVILNLDLNKLQLRSNDAWIDNPLKPSTISSINSNTSLDYGITYEVDTTLGSIILTLPTAIGNSGKTISVRKVDSSVNTITIETVSSQTINGDTTSIIQYQNTFVTFNSNGANFFLS